MRTLLTEGTDVTGDETMVDPLETDMGGDGGRATTRSSSRTSRPAAIA